LGAAGTTSRRPSTKAATEASSADVGGRDRVRSQSARARPSVDGVVARSRASAPPGAAEAPVEKSTPLASASARPTVAIASCGSPAGSSSVSKTKRTDWRSSRRRCGAAGPATSAKTGPIPVASKMASVSASPSSGRRR